MTNVQRQLFAAFMQLPAINPAPIDAQTTVGAAINNIDGNKFRTAEWAQRHLDTTRQQHWISTKSTINSSYFSNPTKAIHTLLNWFEAIVTESYVKAIKYIESLNQPMKLAESVRVACQAQGITLTLGKKQFANVFSCTEPEYNPVLIVAVATGHAHEKGGVGMPVDEQFTVLLLL